MVNSYQLDEHVTSSKPCQYFGPLTTIDRALLRVACAIASTFNDMYILSDKCVSEEPIHLQCAHVYRSLGSGLGLCSDGDSHRPRSSLS